MSWGPTEGQQTKFCVCKFIQSKYCSLGKIQKIQKYRIMWVWHVLMDDMLLSYTIMLAWPFALSSLLLHSMIQQVVGNV